MCIRDRCVLNFTMDGTESSTALADLNGEDVYYVLPSAIAINDGSGVSRKLVLKAAGGFSAGASCLGCCTLDVHKHVDDNTRITVGLNGFTGTVAGSTWSLYGQITYPIA